jgi:hypothetical protein
MSSPSPQTVRPENFLNHLPSGTSGSAWLFAVKTTRDFNFQPFDFGGVVGFDHSLGEFGQFFPRELACARQFKSELNHPRLFRARQAFYFFNDFDRSHVATQLDNEVAFK